MSIASVGKKKEISLHSPQGGRHEKRVQKRLGEMTAASIHKAMSTPCSAWKEAARKGTEQSGGGVGSVRGRRRLQ